MKTALLAAAAVAALALPAEAQTLRASAQLQALGGSNVTGSVTLTQGRRDVALTATVRGLRPGRHGFHIHERGDCSAADGSSAGGHFNPTGAQHGHPGRGAHHAGDLPQLVANRRGVATLSTRLRGVTLRAGPNSVMGLAVVVHADPDDYRTQPAGNSGARIACGVISAR